jgi:hypothetical protein
MNQRSDNMINRIQIIIFWSSFFSVSAIAQTQITKPDLGKNNLMLVNRAITVTLNHRGKSIVHLDAKPNNGLVWISKVNFSTGIIEFDVKGKNLLQQSFAGIAFHGLNDSTYDGIYFRPFNFKSPDMARKKHTVQYISLPEYDWSVLRETFPGKYENALVNNIDPDNWFHVRMVVTNSRITVYVNNNSNASLWVQPLSNLISGKLGFWTGNNSGGDFANLVVKE